MFFVFDGLDGAGKSTQLASFVEWLREQGRDVITCSDPGSTELGERLRSILLGKHEIPISMQAEMMLFTTARTQLVQQIIKPALAAGKTVVLDRYVLSTIVYQGHAGDLAPQTLTQINEIATEGLWPDLTFILDLPVDVALERLGESLDRMESRGAAYFKKVRQGFLAEAAARKQVKIICADRERQTIQTNIRQLASSHLNSANNLSSN